ncbi:MAG: hypothetical protein V3W41_12065 [Planctomycetota bacterium]
MISVWQSRLLVIGLPLMLGALFLGACSEEGQRPESKRESTKSSGRGGEVASGQPVVVLAKVDKARVEVGEKVIYRVEVRFSPDVKVEFPSVLHQFANWLVHDVGSWRSEADFGTKKVKAIEVVLDPGIGPVLSIPPTNIRWRYPDDDAWEVLATEAITVEIAATSSEELDFREPIVGFSLPQPAPSDREKPQGLIAILALGIAGLLGLLCFVIFRNKKKKVIVLPPPHFVATQELDALEGAGLARAGKVKEYYYRLTGILRRYIEAQFGVAATDQTTEEFLDAMRRGDELPEGQKSVLQEFLTQADMVKYAKHQPEAAESDAALTVARRFVELTRSSADGLDPSNSASKATAHAL